MASTFQDRSSRTYRYRSHTSSKLSSYTNDCSSYSRNYSSLNTDLTDFDRDVKKLLERTDRFAHRMEKLRSTSTKDSYIGVHASTYTKKGFSYGNYSSSRRTCDYTAPKRTRTIKTTVYDQLSTEGEWKKLFDEKKLIGHACELARHQERYPKRVFRYSPESRSPKGRDFPLSNRLPPYPESPKFLRILEDSQSIDFNKNDDDSNNINHNNNSNNNNNNTTINNNNNKCNNDDNSNSDNDSNDISDEILLTNTLNYIKNWEYHKNCISKPVTDLIETEEIPPTKNIKMGYLDKKKEMLEMLENEMLEISENVPNVDNIIEEMIEKDKTISTEVGNDKSLNMPPEYADSNENDLTSLSLGKEEKSELEKGIMLANSIIGEDATRKIIKSFQLPSDKSTPALRSQSLKRVLVENDKHSVDLKNAQQRKSCLPAFAPITTPEKAANTKNEQAEITSLEGSPNKSHIDHDHEEKLESSSIREEEDAIPLRERIRKRFSEDGSEHILRSQSLKRFQLPSDKSTPALRSQSLKRVRVGSDKHSADLKNAQQRKSCLPAFAPLTKPEKEANTKNKKVEMTSVEESPNNSDTDNEHKKKREDSSITEDANIVSYFHDKIYGFSPEVLTPLNSPKVQRIPLRERMKKISEDDSEHISRSQSVKRFRLPSDKPLADLKNAQQRKSCLPAFAPLIKPEKEANTEDVSKEGYEAVIEELENILQSNITTDKTLCKKEDKNEIVSFLLAESSFAKNENEESLNVGASADAALAENDPTEVVSASVIKPTSNDGLPIKGEVLEEEEEEVERKEVNLLQYNISEEVNLLQSNISDIFQDDDHLSMQSPSQPVSHILHRVINVGRTCYNSIRNSFVSLTCSSK